MTGPTGTPAESRRSAASDGWHASLPELAAGAFVVLVTSLGAYAYAGLGAAVLVIAGWSIAAIAYLRTLVPAAEQPLIEQASSHGSGRTGFLGFWRKRTVLQAATTAMTSYDAELRPALQHLLAARLAERHDVSLNTDPAAARRLLLPGPRDDALWFWLDPQRPAEKDPQRPGIPPRILAAILDRLERL